ncbi:hypothetical protein SDC9_191996 [bioreactor metagenome]|uniref:Uncharacterized protein n=1 Tax=bioreactor metagenome TaxID=1076179 RepID=A0A645HZF3_9ZZZZ
MSNIGHMVDFAQKGFDGIIHLMPFSCLPELVTRSVIPVFCEDYDIPVLSISLDEQMGAANNQTRLEAFVDLIKSKKENRQPTIKGIDCGKRVPKIGVELAEVKQ